MLYLRSVLRESDSISIGELAKSEAEEISFIYNQPLWLVNLWINEMGKDKTMIFVLGLMNNLV